MNLALALSRAAAPLLAVLLLATGASAADPSSTPDDVDSSVHGFPSARANLNTPGRYSWTEGGWDWMHKVPCAIGSEWGPSGPCRSDERFGPVEITFGIVDESAGIPGSALSRPQWNEERYDSPMRVADLRTQLWLLDVGERRVFVLVESRPETRSTDVIEAEAIVDSIRVEPTGDPAGYRLVFTLPAGWDSG